MTTQNSQSTGAALVTGGAQRLGAHMCLKLSDMGYKIALHYNHSEKKAKSVQRQIEETGGRCAIFSCDLTDIGTTAHLIKSVASTFADLNVLVNNASKFLPSRLKEDAVERFDEDFTIHVKAPMILMRDFSQICKKGVVINLLDRNIVRHQSGHASYLLSKKSLSELTKMAALEFAPNIRVNAIAPGFILPPEHTKETDSHRLIERIPLGQKGEPHDVTSTLEYLLKTPYLTGQIIYVDGGEHLLN